MALLQVYPWHVDTLLQMSEVYRLQSGECDAPPALAHPMFHALAVGAWGSL
jgi:hypothetical protein